MQMLELYNGEGRSRGWWKVIKRHTLFLAFSVSLPVTIVFVQSRFPAANLFGYLLPWVCAGLLAWILLIGLAMSAPRFWFAFYYWNFWLFCMVVLPLAFLAIFFTLGQSGDIKRIGAHLGIPGEWILIGFCVIAWILSVLIKTVIVYTQFKGVSRDTDGKQMLRMPR